MERVSGTAPAVGRNLSVAASDSADDFLAALQVRLRVDTRQGHENAPGIGRGNDTIWRRPGRVAARYARLVDHATQKRLNAACNYDLLAGEEPAARCVAINRMHLGGVLTQLDTYPEFMRRGQLIPSQIEKNVDIALRDLLAEMEGKGHNDHCQCKNTMVFEEYFS